jgi:hypothetical protein
MVNTPLASFSRRNAYYPKGLRTNHQSHFTRMRLGTQSMVDQKLGQMLAKVHSQIEFGTGLKIGEGICGESGTYGYPEMCLLKMK